MCTYKGPGILFSNNLSTLPGGKVAIKMHYKEDTKVSSAFSKTKGVLGWLEI